MASAPPVLASLTALCHRTLVVAGNGPSAAQADLSAIPDDAVVFRMNHFYLEDRFYFGRRVDALFWSIYNDMMHERFFEQCVHSGRYEVGVFAYPALLFGQPRRKRPARQGILYQKAFTPHFDHWNFLMEHPVLRRFIAERPRPTMGLQAVATGMLLGFTKILVAGIDFYATPPGTADRYFYELPADVKVRMRAKDYKPGYEAGAHSLELDMEFFAAIRESFPEVRLANVSPGSKMRDYLPAAPSGLPRHFPAPAAKPDSVVPKPLPHPVRTLALFDGIDRASRETGMNKSLHAARNMLCGMGVRQDLISARELDARTLPGLWWRLLRMPWKTTDVLLINSVAPFLKSLASTRALVYAARLWERPVVIYWHEMAWVLERIRDRHPECFAYLQWLCARRWCHHLAASAATSRDLQALLKPRQEPILVYECIEAPPAAARPGQSIEPTIVTVASVQERKGPDLFLETARLVLERMPGARFHWVGDGPLHRCFTHMVRKRGLEGRVFFWGRVQPPLAMLERAHVFFLPSRDDPFPLAVLESMAIGLPVVAFTSGGAAEALGSDRAIAPDFNPAEAAERICRLLQARQPGMRDEALVSRFARNFGMERFCTRVGLALQKSLAIDASFREP